MQRERFDYWLARLVSEDVILRAELGDEQQLLLARLSELGIAHRISADTIAFDGKVELFNAAQLQQQLAKLAADIQLDYRLVTESTNLDAIALFNQHQTPCVALAEMQTGGKGRRGNLWVSPFARNIYCSLGLVKSIKPAQLGLLSIITGIALCQALQQCGVPGVKLKWPNDLLFAQQKLGGILIESKSLADDRFFLAIGFGINVAMDEAELAAIPQAATSLQQIAGASISRGELVVAALSNILSRIETFDGNEVDGLIDEFTRHDSFSEQLICAKSAEQTTCGKNRGINACGQLVLETEQGCTEFSAADISLRAAP